MQEVSSRTHYICYFDEKVKLTNGFRYIKELILQTRNFRMYQDFLKLQENRIPVYSVKTDAFTIKSSDVKKSKGDTRVWKEHRGLEKLQERGHNGSDQTAQSHPNQAVKDKAAHL
jgi:hypothetical protein